MTAADLRLSVGLPQLDAALGGGLIPGTLTVVMGATGVGKTQLGVHFARAGVTQEETAGVIFDLSARGDSQSHAEYARRIFSWELRNTDPHAGLDLDRFFSSPQAPTDYLRIFDYRGQRVTRRDLDFEQWHEWQGQLNAKLRGAIAFLYGAFVRGVRRVVVDGIEPTDRPGESIQFNLFEYLYHQVLRKDPDWVARDLFREQFRRNEPQVMDHRYDPQHIGCMLLVTSHESMLEDLLTKPLSEGDVLSNANTVILMGRIRDQDRLGRGIYIAKHRGSQCSEEILPFRIEPSGLQV